MKLNFLIAFLFSSFLFSQSKLNLDFENLNDNNQNRKWLTNKKDNYIFESDSIDKYSGNKSLKITGKNIENNKDNFAVIMQNISKKYLNGKEIILKARIKSQSDFDGATFPYLKTLDKDKKTFHSLIYKTNQLKEIQIGRKFH